MKSLVIDLRPAAGAAQRLFTANQILFVIALAFGIVLGADLVTKGGTDGYVRTAANDAVRVFLLTGLFVYALLFALMDYARRYWIGVGLAAALVLAALIVLGNATVIEMGQQSDGYVENGLITVGLLGPFVIWFASQLAGCMRLLREDAAPLGGSLVVVDQRIRELANSLVEAGHAARPRFPWLGTTILAISLAAIGVTILSFLALMGLGKQVAGSTASQVAGDAAIVGLLTLPFWALLLQLGRRLSRPDAASLLEADQRAPIVLLRSFQDDSKSVKSRNVLARLLFWGFGGRIRLEQAIAGELARFGPFVAIGQPGERLPRLGAARAYFSDDEWQAAVHEWIGRARTLTIIAGMTRWLTWELQQVIASGKLDRLVLLLPPDTPAGRTARWDLIAEALRGSSWRAALEDIDSHTIALCQRPGTKNEIITFSSAAPQQVDYEIAIRLAVYAMHVGGKPEIAKQSHANKVQKQASC
jgi:hypothetical protein